MVNKDQKLIGKLETLGELLGEKKDMSEYLKVRKIFVVFYLNHLIQYFEEYDNNNFRFYGF